jgi:dihydroflavonol-4-reductase
VDLRGATVAVTGATGFLGRYVVDVLQERGARVVAVVRNPARAPELAERGVTLRRADLADAEALAAGFAGADAVISNAALFSLWNQRRGAYLRTNLEGTRNVFEAMARAGVRRAVHVSSTAVYRGQPAGPITEDQDVHDGRTGRRPWNAYGISKALAEQEAWRLARERGIALTVVRPFGMYGAFDRHFMRVHKAFVAPPIGVYPVGMRFPVVYAGDVADGIARCLERDAAIGRVYNLAGEDATAWDFLRAWAVAGGRMPWLVVPIPVWMRRRYSTARARAELGWSTRPAVEGLRETLLAEAAGSAARRIGFRSATKALSARA